MMGLISIANIIFNPMYDWYVYVVAVVIFTISSILLDGLVALIIRKMNEKHFDYHKKIFNASSKRIRFYESLGIKKWKDKVLELGMFTLILSHIAFSIPFVIVSVRSSLTPAKPTVQRSSATIPGQILPCSRSTSKG